MTNRNQSKPINNNHNDKNNTYINNDIQINSNDSKLLLKSLVKNTAYSESLPQSPHTTNEEILNKISTAEHVDSDNKQNNNRFIPNNCIKVKKEPGAIATLTPTTVSAAAISEKVNNSKMKSDTTVLPKQESFK